MITATVFARGGNRESPPTRPIGDPGAQTANATAVAKTAAARTSPTAPVSQLLAALPSMRQLDAATLRRWVEGLGLVRPAAASPATAGGDLLRLLRAAASAETMQRELFRFADQPRRARAEPEPGTAKTPAQENLLPATREAIRLIEQALTQNLLQRVSAGLQQEAQQPATLGFALPVLDEHQVKPLQIELGHRQAEQESGAPVWEVRIGFEFADLGPVSCHLLLDGVAVTASFYCATESTRDRVEQALPSLRRQLGAAGFVATELHGFVATGEAANRPPEYRVGDALIDLEA